ncbi:peptidase inhibitor family I36 protein [Streptomyces sp. NPDC000594]|uniref:peptidase inhibitor family I36 protein n=1 Tax=Streptomyces sp. NPDC000594 TaxID=3154261 RepID=UPI00331C566A
MNWVKRSAAVISTLAVAGAWATVSAAPATAAGGCPTARLCVWDGTDFLGTRIASASTNACFFINDTAGFSSVRSYSNNSAVSGKIYEYGPGGYFAARTLSAGGFSSDIGTPRGGGVADMICMGNATP